MSLATFGRMYPKVGHSLRGFYPCLCSLPGGASSIILSPPGYPIRVVRYAPGFSRRARRSWISAVDRGSRALPLPAPPISQGRALGARTGAATRALSEFRSLKEFKMAHELTDRLYKTARWQRIRAQLLRERPLCEVCTHIGRVTLASVADHHPPHGGNVELFWCSLKGLRALCARCHGQVRPDQQRGYSNAIGIDGNPIDASHPAWGGAKSTKT